ncbi:hypothetical protein GO308_09770 [Sphingomonas sp. SFZ2018-12]|uniref:phage head morphogenesis protein n=1 Tax=Sphingomonas sp. SFZ2018-12 TaxID=2683197 RepID=UPI001F10A297|nr:phage head morphogenesis protein [Sphingomonas sp. SFZ2018-12]MCH4893396.1 hypothetical protein [Sphingomonas sp. SFZ2018-12]
MTMPRDLTEAEARHVETLIEIYEFTVADVAAIVLAYRDPARSIGTIEHVVNRLYNGAHAQERIGRQSSAFPMIMFGITTYPPYQCHEPTCLALDGLVVEVHDPLWDYAFPPNGPDCLCRPEQVTHRRLKRLGLRLSFPSNVPRPTLGYDRAWAAFSDRTEPPGFVDMTRVEVRL